MKELKLLRDEGGELKAMMKKQSAPFMKSTCSLKVWLSLIPPQFVSALIIWSLIISCNENLLCMQNTLHHFLRNLFTKTLCLNVPSEEFQVWKLKIKSIYITHISIIYILLWHGLYISFMDIWYIKFSSWTHNACIIKFIYI